MVSAHRILIFVFAFLLLSGFTHLPQTAKGADGDTFGSAAHTNDSSGFPPLGEYDPPSNGGAAGANPPPRQGGSPPDGQRPFQGAGAGAGRQHGGRSGATSPATRQIMQSQSQQPQQVPQGALPQNGQPSHHSRAVPDPLRSLMDTNNPFYALQLSSGPVDPNTSITGEPLTIYELLKNVSSPHNRTVLLRAYWDLTGEIAKYKVAIQKTSQLITWTKEVDTTHVKYPVLQAAAQLAQSQQMSQELTVQKKQAVLASLMKRTGAAPSIVLASQTTNNSEVNPIPVDLPFIGEYRSKVNQLVHYKSTGADLIQMDKIIKIQRLLVSAKGNECVNADAFFNQVQQTQGSVEAWILTQNQYLTAYCSYIDAIIDYNLHIADYVKETVGPEITGRPLLTTIIQLNPLPAAAPLGQHETGMEDPANTVPTVP